ncbi:MAG: cytochrome C oxidase subunit IV family protein [Acidimicrobiia bacterium]
MSEPTETTTETAESTGAGVLTQAPAGEAGVVDLPQGDLEYRMHHAAPNLLPGEVIAHPDPIQYVMVAVVLSIITAIEIATSYLEGDIPDGLIVTLLLAMGLVKFVLVASWFMHLRTDKPVFRRFFILGACAAVGLYAIVLATLHAIVK